ncbi:hypothetical protein AG0111_0g7102 [Alternaria gaisen]|uniref:Uncharacterized protein n=1 Tax=Alternaria gaisen TaxID=167740 RepID=A0ACB6FL44_9PLEO|nr:hypothetical protein AG0111_0g7102 [Alternaria gaisen]
MGQRIPAVFVNGLKNACVWEHDWGFVVYRAAFSDGDAWDRFRATFSSVNHQSFDRLAAFYSNPDDVRVSQRFWRCRFVDEPGLEGKDPAAIREHYSALWRDLPSGLQHPLCLVATKEIFDSFERYTASYSDATSATIARADPFIKVLYQSHLVDNDMDDDEDPPVKMFNAGMRALIDELFPISIRTEMSFDKVDRGNDDKVWLGFAWEVDIILGSG